MQLLFLLSDFLVPFIIFWILVYGLFKGYSVYEVFVQGAIKGLKIIIKIFPTLLGLMIAVSILRTSGFLEDFCSSISWLGEWINLPGEIFPLILVKLFSSSAATGMLIDIYKEFGCDSYLGILASLICSSTETVFYTMSIYFVSVGVKKTRWTLAGALFASFMGIIASMVIAKAMI